jgi:hypothetical protein
MHKLKTKYSLIIPDSYYSVDNTKTKSVWDNCGDVNTSNIVFRHHYIMMSKLNFFGEAHLWFDQPCQR